MSRAKEQPEALRAVVIVNHGKLPVEVGPVRIPAGRLPASVGSPHEPGPEYRAELSASDWFALSDQERGQLRRLDAELVISLRATPGGVSL